MLRYKHQEKSFSLQKDNWLQCKKMLKYALTTIMVVQYMQVQSKDTNSTNDICRGDK